MDLSADHLLFPIHYSLTVVQRHCLVNAVADDGAERFGAPLQNLLDLFPLPLREAFEDEVGRVPYGVLRPDADAQARELVRAERRDDVLQALLPAARARRPEAHGAEREGDVVADHDEVASRLQLGALAQKARDRLAAQVHVGLRLDQLDRAPLKLGPPDERPALRALDLRARLPRQKVYDHEAQVVARPLVALARIAQTDDEHDVILDF